VQFGAKCNRTGGATLLAVVTLHPGEPGRHYRLPTERDYKAVFKAQTRLRSILDEWERGGRKGLCPVPDEPLPPIGTLGFRVQRYGMMQWGDLFTARQKVGLVSLARAFAGRGATRRGESANEFGRALQATLSQAFSRVAMSGMSLTRWNAVAEKMQHTFGRQALPIVWDFAEVVPMEECPGNWQSGYELVADVAAAFLGNGNSGTAQLADAAASPLPAESVGCWFTDPPYYDAIPYSDLSDFFFTWLKRTLNGHALLCDPFDSANPLTPKDQEAVQDGARTVNGHPKDRAFFEERMASAFREGRRVLSPDGAGCVVFAHKTTEGWEALLGGMMRGGWVITASWPITTEMAL
jgi:adenine-specific DNA methylase